jgi:predicted ABC-type transport system involved in lysophospholipase L1 biosynthesis ATPase subunit
MQRAVLARALVAGPQVVFADEPTGTLDTVGGERLLKVLLSTAHRLSIERDGGTSVCCSLPWRRFFRLVDR